MSHSHSHNSYKTHSKAFAIGIIANIIFVFVEVAYGLIANSSALLADAGHNASDVLGLVFAWLAAWLATHKPKGKYTYGFRKTTILASVLNAILLFGAVGFIGWDAIGKFRNPQPVLGTQVMVVAAVGVVVNTLTALLFVRGKKHDLNIRGAFLHMAADAGVSLGVLVAGLLINLTGKLWIDPVASLIVIAVVLWSAWHLFVESVNLALDAVPKGIELEEVRGFLLNQDGVEDIHDLHIWALSTTQVALTAHLLMPSGYEKDFIPKLQGQLKNKFGIGHTTLQIETQGVQKECEKCCCE